LLYNLGVFRKEFAMGDPKKNQSSGEDVIHDTGNKFNPVIPGPLDADTHKPTKHRKRVRIKRRRNGKKEVSFPPAKTIYPLDPVAGATGQAADHPDVKVSGYVHTVSKPKTGPPPEPPPNDPEFGDYYGNMVLFCVDGCPDATFYQFVKETLTYSNKGETGSATDWGYDTSDGKPGKYQVLPDEPAAGASSEPATFDAPGQWGEPASTRPPLNVPPHAGDTLTRTDEFETFVCCSKKLIGYWSWQQTLTYTWGKTGGWGAPDVTPASPTWNQDPTTGGNPYDRLHSDKLCSGK
jgi:hypothetical protein